MHIEKIFSKTKGSGGIPASLTRSPLDLSFREHQISPCVPSAALAVLKAQPLVSVSFPKASVGMFLPLPEQGWEPVRLQQNPRQRVLQSIHLLLLPQACAQE